MKSDSTKIGILRFIFWMVLPVAMLLVSVNVHAQVGINTDNSIPHASSMLDVKATGLGFLAPRMSSANKPASPATGLLIYQTDIDPGYYYFDGAVWQKVGRKSDQIWSNMTGGIYYNSGNVAVGVEDSESHGLNVVHYTSGTSAVRGMDRNGDYLYAEGQLGVLAAGLLSLPIDVYNIGVLGIKPALGSNGAAVYGWNLDVSSINYAGVLVSDGASSGTNYGLLSKASNSTTTNYAGYFAAEGVTVGSNYGIFVNSDNAGISNYAGYFSGRVAIIGKSNSSSAGDKYSPLLSVTVGVNDAQSDVKAIDVNSTVDPGYGYGVYAVGGYMGVRASTDYTDYSGTAYGVYGSATGSAGTRIGVYGIASGGTTNWAGYFNGSAYVSADLRIGTLSAATGYKLSVNGKIACEEVLVQDDGTWPDYVFNEDYSLLSLEELESSINSTNHLPGIPSAAEVEEHGVLMGDMQKRLLEKVEELTLYTIEQGKLIRQLQDEVEALKTGSAAPLK